MNMSVKAGIVNIIRNSIFKMGKKIWVGRYRIECCQRGDIESMEERKEQLQKHLNRLNALKERFGVTEKLK